MRKSTYYIEPGTPNVYHIHSFNDGHFELWFWCNFQSGWRFLSESDSHSSIVRTMRSCGTNKIKQAPFQTWSGFRKYAKGE